MTFTELIEKRQSCRAFDPARDVSDETLHTVLKAARLAPSACNGQPYHFTVCRGELAKQVAKATQGMGMNAFTNDAPVMIVVSEKPYVKTAAVGAKLKKNDYRSIDIGIATAYLTAAATEQGLSTCILGWLDNEKLQTLCDLDGTARLVIALGYAKENDVLRTKKRKPFNELVSIR